MTEPWPHVPSGGVRIATWNLERPKAASWKKAPRQLAQMSAVGADIWVLTETRASVALGDGFTGVHSPPHPARRPDPDERWVSIWSRWPIRNCGVDPSARGSVAASISTPLGPLVVYGTVLPWAHEPAASGALKLWDEHYREIERQGSEWAGLRSTHPDAALCVAGDFNQSRDGSPWYGTHRGRDLLTTQLDRSDLECTTSDDMVARGKLAAHHLIDHICLSRDWCDRYAMDIRCWEPRDHDGTRMSDHPGVAVDIYEAV